MAKRKAAKSGPSIDEIRRLGLTAIFADDEFLHTFALKGGGALDIAYHISSRASVDLDLSMRESFGQDIGTMRARFEALLRNRFESEGIHVFDVTLETRPAEISADIEEFWGGYLLSFKLVQQEKREALSDDLEQLRRNALIVSVAGSSRFEIDISRYECLDALHRIEIDGQAVAVYQPSALVFEKLRAICQQMPEYGVIIHRKRAGAGRARDFFDIVSIQNRFPQLDLNSPDSSKLLSRFFGIKHVPMEYLGRIGIDETREFHRPAWKQVLDTVSNADSLQDFDYYFDHVAGLSTQLCETLGIPHSPPL